MNTVPNLFAVKLDKFFRSYNILNNLSNKVYVPNKTEDLDIHVLNMNAGKNKSKVLTEFYIMRM